MLSLLFPISVLLFVFDFLFFFDSLGVLSFICLLLHLGCVLYVLIRDLMVILLICGLDLNALFVIQGNPSLLGIFLVVLSHSLHHKGEWIRGSVHELREVKALEQGVEILLQSRGHHSESTFLLVEQNAIRENQFHVLSELLRLFVYVVAEFMLYCPQIHGGLHDVEIVGNFVLLHVDRVVENVGIFGLPQIAQNLDCWMFPVHLLDTLY